MSRPKKRIQYMTYPSDDDEWIILELIDKKIKLDLHKEVLTFRYDCVPHDVDVGGEIVPCSRFCCYDGCYISPQEKSEVERILPDLIKEGYLQDDSLEVLRKNNNEIIVHDDYDEEENLYKTRCAPCEPRDLEDEDFEDETDENGNDSSLTETSSKNTRTTNSDVSSNTGENKGRNEDSTKNRAEDGNDSGNKNENKNGNNNDNNNRNENGSENDKEFFTVVIDDNTDKLENEEEQSLIDYSTLENSIDEIPVTHCIFLMKNGYCATHAYYNDHNIDWTTNKFNICTTFPMDLRVSINDADDAPYPPEKRVDDDCSTLKMMDDFEEFLFSKMDCIHLHPYIKAKKGVPYILDSMKYAIVTRLGEDMWHALKHYASLYRKRLKKKRKK